MALYKIEVPFGHISGETYSEIKGRVERERDFWAEFGSFHPTSLMSPNGGSHSAPHVQAVDEMLQEWNNFYTRLDAIDGRTFNEEFDGLKVWVEGNNVIPPLSTSSIGRAAKLHFESGRTHDLLRLLIGFLLSTGRLLQPHLNTHSELGAYYGALNASFSNIALLPFVVEEGSSNEARSELRIVKGFVSETGEISERLKRLEADLILEADVARVNIADQFSSDRQRILKRYRTQATLSRKAERNREEQFDALQKAFNWEMRIKRPVELWKERQVEHTNNSKSAWLVFALGSGLLGVSALLVALFLGDYVAAAFIPANCFAGFELSCDRISAKGPLTISMILLISTVWLWFLRFQMKVHLSERHLALDARERRAFAETYLSLLKGNHVTQEHEAVVLQSLFRPTQDGIIKDEGGPDLGVASVLSRALDRR